MSVNETYQPINCDDYNNLGLACQHHLSPTLALKNSEILQTRANDLISRKNVEYLAADVADETRELRLDKTANFSHPQINTMVISESWLFRCRATVQSILSGLLSTPNQTYVFFIFHRSLTRRESTRSRS